MEPISGWERRWARKREGFAGGGVGFDLRGRPRDLARARRAACSWLGRVVRRVVGAWLWTLMDFMRDSPWGWG